MRCALRLPPWQGGAASGWAEPGLRRLLAGGVTVVAAALFASFAAAPPAAAQPVAQGQAALPLPATFTGTLPCADCPGLQYHLNLVPARTPYAGDQGRYELRLRYLGPKAGKPEVERGAWRLSGDGSTLTAGGGKERRLFRVDASGSLLTLLDRDGHAIASNLNYTLERANAFVAIKDAERAEQLATTDAPIENTYWKLIALGSQPVAVPANGQREAHLVLHTKEARLAGSGGCNRLMGNFERNGDALRFPPVASTRLNCPEGMEQEAVFLHTLERVAAWHVKGRQLDLLDAAGVGVARFEAVALR